MAEPRERISPLDVRKRLGELLDRVDLRSEEFIVERKGHPLAALIPVPKLERLDELAARVAAAPLEERRGSGLTQRDADERAAAAVAASRTET